MRLVVEVKRFALLEAETTQVPDPLNTAGTEDLSLLRALLEICQMSRGPSFWETIDSFALSEEARFAALKTFLGRFPVCLNSTLDVRYLLCWYK